MSEKPNILYQMACKAGGYFDANLLNQWPGASEYFNAHDCESEVLVLSLLCCLSSTILWYGNLIFTLLLTGSFKSEKQDKVIIYDLPIEDCIANAVLSDSLDQEQVESMAKVMKFCLRLDPEKRASAEKLLEDPWFLGV